MTAPIMARGPGGVRRNAAPETRRPAVFLPMLVPLWGLWFGVLWLNLRAAGLIPPDDFSRALEDEEW